MNDLTAPDWTDAAACLYWPGDLWFPTGYGHTPPDWDQPRGICSTCPVQAECLQLAIDNGEPEGMWGGLTPDERKRLGAKNRRNGAGPKQLDPITNHGTEAGARRHRRRNQRPCPDCLTAERVGRAGRKYSTRRSA